MAVISLMDNIVHKLCTKIDTNSTKNEIKYVPEHIIGTVGCESSPMKKIQVEK